MIIHVSFCTTCGKCGMWVVYNLGQRELRKTLKKSNSKVRNQLGKLTNTPTLRWIFQCFQVVHFLRINQSPKVVNLTED